MKLSVLSDEISTDPVAAAELASRWGIRHFELRGWMRCRAPGGMTLRDMEWTGRVCSDFGIDIPSISPGLFKVHIDDETSLRRHRTSYKRRCFELAKTVGAQVIVVFPPIRREGDGWWDWPPQVVEDMRCLAEEAAKLGLRIALENEPACYAGCGQALAELIRQIDHPNLGANWDPGNHAHATGEDFSDAYRQLQPFHIHTHVKDYPGKGQRAVPPGEGIVNWLDQLRAMQQNGYNGLVVLETHFTPRIEGTQRCVERIKELFAEIGEPVE